MSKVHVYSTFKEWAQNEIKTLEDKIKRQKRALKNRNRIDQERILLHNKMKEVLEWYAGYLRPEDRLSDNGERAEKVLKELI